MSDRSTAIIAAVASQDLRVDQPPFSVLEELQAQSVRLETAAPAGKLVWRRWGDRSGRPLVMLHGGGGSWRHWVRNIPALARHYTLWIPDLPGYGESDLPAEPHSYDGITDALLAGLAQLLPGEAFDLVGFSFGSVSAARLAQHVEDRVRHVVLVGPNFVSDMSSARFNGMRNWRRLADPVQRMAAMHSNMQVMMIADPARIDELALYIYSYDLRFQRLSPIAMTGRTPQFAEVKKIAPQVRVSGISGADDQVFAHVMAQQAQSLEAMRPGSPFYALPGASHWVMYEAAEEFNRILLDLLADKHPAPVAA